MLTLMNFIHCIALHELKQERMCSVCSYWINALAIT